jgi:peroxiredoxin
MTKKAVVLITAILLLITGVLTFAGCERSCPSIDTKAPEFTISDLNGNSVALKDFLGKNVMLVFWQTTCTWCSYQMPFVQQLAAKYADSGLSVLSINIGESIEKVKSYKQSGNYTLNFLLDKEGITYTYYCVPGFPAEILIDKQGILKKGNFGAFQTVDEMEEFIKYFY